MKTKVLASIALGLCLCSIAGAASISTTDGVTFNNVTTQRVDPDGLYIEYLLPGGGLGMSKIKFSRLSADQQKQYGYNATKAHDYEVQVAKANEEFRQESLHDQQIAQAARQARAEREASAPVYHTAPPVQVNAEEAAPAAMPYGYAGDWGYGGGVGVVAVPNVGRAPAARRDYLSPVRPIPFPTVNTPQQPPPFRAHVTPGNPPARSVTRQ